MPALVPYQGIVTVAYRMIRILPTSGDSISPTTKSFFARYQYTTLLPFAYI